jgi:acyl-CoA synthetase (AMP-forming)/AMP-acid ligase II
MIFRSPFPDAPVPDSSIFEFVLERAASLGEKPALIDGPSGRVVTYAQLLARSRALAAGLARRGLGKGDVVAVSCPNLPEYAVIFHGVAMAGGTLTTANPLLTPEELNRQLVDSGARSVVTIPQLLDGVRAATPGTRVEEIAVMREGEGEGEEEGEGEGEGEWVRVVSMSSLFMAGGEPPAVRIDPASDVVVMPYSSGTTGLPKGVMLTHRNLVANIGQIAPHEPVSGDDVMLGVLPFFHIYGMVVIMGLALRMGATIVTMPRFELAPFLDTLQRYGVTRAHVVPPIVLALAKHPLVDKYDLSKLRWIFSGAAPLGAEVAEACARRLGCSVRQGYGLTETSPGTHIMPVPPAPQKPGSVGPPVPNTEVTVRDAITGAELGTGATGEIHVRGPQVMKGYLNNPAATSAMISEDGWLRTGDIGYADEDGYFFIVDRAKELIKYKGYQVPPAELEALLLTHPAIADAAVIGVPDEEADEVPKAFVVRRADLTPHEVMDFVAAHVAPYKKLRYVEFRESIPKSPSGKILRRVLAAEERAAHGG